MMFTPPKYNILLVASIAITYILVNIPVGEAVAQAPYLSMKTSPVTPDKSTNVAVFCKEGDGMISGGYTMNFSSVQAAFDTVIYANRPTQQINQTGYFEGWEAGLVNGGNEIAEITTTVLCLNLTLTP
jgi:hypothetical protein